MCNPYRDQEEVRIVAEGISTADRHSAKMLMAFFDGLTAYHRERRLNIGRSEHRANPKGKQRKYAVDDTKNLVTRKLIREGFSDHRIQKIASVSPERVYRIRGELEDELKLAV